MKNKLKLYLIACIVDLFNMMDYLNYAAEKRLKEEDE